MILIVLVIWKAGIEFVVEYNRCEMAFLYLDFERLHASQTAEGIGGFDVYPVRHGSRFLNLAYGDGLTEPYNKEHTSHQLRQGYVVSIGSFTAVRYPEKGQKGRP